LRITPSAEWQSRVAQFEIPAANVLAKAKAAGVPLAAVFVPNRAQAAIISKGDWPPGYDPYKLNQELRSIITRYGGTYIDILPDYQTIPEPEEGYLSVDGHPNAEGHKIIADLLARELTSGAIPALKSTAQSQVASAQGR